MYYDIWKFVQLKNTLFKWFIYLCEQLSMLFQVEVLGTVCRWNNAKLAFVRREDFMQEDE